MSFNGIETYEELEARDAVERKQLDFPLEEATRADSGELLLALPASLAAALLRNPTLTSYTYL